jgi:rRNA-processing protein FCF1
VALVLVDAENVRRSQWSNIGERELVDLVRAWAEEEGHDALIVFDVRAPVEAPDVVATPSADDWIAERASELDGYWLVTSDRELRQRAGGRAERVIGGGSFANELRPRG